MSDILERTLDVRVKHTYIIRGKIRLFWSKLYLSDIIIVWFEGIIFIHSRKVDFMLEEAIFGKFLVRVY